MAIYQGPSILPQGTPRSLSEEIKELPRQYLEVLTKPGVATIAAQMGKANCRVVWVQLLGWGVISTILGFVAQVIFISMSYRFAGSLSPEAIQALSANSSSYGGIIGVPLGFFIWMGLVYLLSKAFNGQGTFLAQSYTSLLFQAPLGVLSAILSLVPYFGLISFAVFIYGIVLQVGSNLFYPTGSFLFTWPLLFSSLALGWLLFMKESAARPWLRTAILAVAAVPAVILLTPLVIYLVPLVSYMGIQMPIPLIPVPLVFIMLLMGLLIPQPGLLAGEPHRQAAVTRFASVGKRYPARLERWLVPVSTLLISATLGQAASPTS